MIKQSCIGCESPVFGEFEIDDMVTCEECW